MDRSVYTRPNKPLSIPVKSRGWHRQIKPVEVVEPVIVDAATECHVTPLDVARRMVEYLGPQGDYLTLEPQAGTGQLVKALFEAGHSKHELLMIERHIKLANNLHGLGTVKNTCFLEYAVEAKGKIEFPRIVMNPPFREVRKHMSAAISLMGKGGHQEPARLIALVPITYQHDEAEELEILPNDTFSTAKVNTKIIKIEKG